MREQPPMQMWYYLYDFECCLLHCSGELRKPRMAVLAIIFTMLFSRDNRLKRLLFSFHHGTIMENENKNECQFDLIPHDFSLRDDCHDWSECYLWQKDTAQFLPGLDLDWSTVWSIDQYWHTLIWHFLLKSVATVVKMPSMHLLSLDNRNQIAALKKHLEAWPFLASVVNNYCWCEFDQYLKMAFWHHLVPNVL